MLGWRAARSPITVKMVVPTWGSLLETWGMDMAPSPACVKEVPFSPQGLPDNGLFGMVCMSFSQAWRLVMLSTQPRTQLPLYGLQVFGSVLPAT